ncbi:hypothetical protein QAD02_021518 [Eretmocerus hayati]|uniref:Uncharacterized protein n=1 Tax=Eretmocerus hayati TaxID=131215 RepID=A0ACC2PVA4_9HYME|nr:hypothetical protein QAD02_021518 [Eretmocerus hayati]
MEGQIWRWGESENKPFQTDKEWRRTVQKSRGTWLEGEEETRIGKKLAEYDITTIEASRHNKKGRASGGLLLATEKPLEAKTTRLDGETLNCEVSVKKERWKMILTYMNEEKGDNWRQIEEQVEEQAGTNLLILGDINARTGREGGSIGKRIEIKGQDQKCRRTEDAEELGNIRTHYPQRHGEKREIEYWRENQIRPHALGDNAQGKYRKEHKEEEDHSDLGRRSERRI